MSVSPVFSMLWVYPGGMSTTCGALARYPVGDHRRVAGLSEADDALAAEHHEFLMLGVMPVLALGDVRTGYVDAHLSVAAQMQKLRERPRASAWVTVGRAKSSGGRKLR